MDALEEKPRITPLQRHLQMETDFFCYQCGYNLHGQIVTRDERLDIMVCRCPECGRFHPAALGVSATRPWLARLGIGLIVAWVLFVLAFCLLASSFQGLMMFAHLETYTARSSNYSRGASNYYYQSPRIVRTRTTENAYYYEQREVAWKILSSVTFALSVVFGGFSAIVMWHVRKDRLYLVLLWPILAALITFILWWANENIELIIGWSITRVAAYTVLNLVGMVVGLKVGRPVIRATLRTIVSPKLRQHVHFLWTCDGKTPPGVSDTAGVPA